MLIKKTKQSLKSHFFARSAEKTKATEGFGNERINYWRNGYSRG